MTAYHIKYSVDPDGIDDLGVGGREPVAQAAREGRRNWRAAALDEGHRPCRR